MVRQTSKKKKKRGRPSLVDLQNRALLQQQQQQQQQSNPNFRQPNPNHLLRRTRTRSSLPAHFIDGSDSGSDPPDPDSNDDDDDERVEKKVKLVVRLPSHDQDEKGSKATDTQNETKILADLDPGPTISITASTPLPDKKLLLLVLDKLQKKDTREVFAEPVDPEELPDYHEVIENPMDFGTVRRKLDGGLYSFLEQLEDDVYLICLNAMQYNAPSTIYFRQARSIQELAKKEFETLRQDGGRSEPPTKPRRGRPPGSRNTKKLVESSPVDRAVPETASDATPASQEDDAMKSNSYNLRKGPSLYRFPRNPESFFDGSASSSKSLSTKYIKKPCGSEENRRETYDLCSQFDYDKDPSLLDPFGCFKRQLIAVGLASSHGYARSLALFGANLGPVVWRIVSKKIRSVLPPGVEFGPGWVDETKVSSMQTSSLPEKLIQSNCMLQDSFKSEPRHPSTSGFVNSTFANKPTTSCSGKLIEARESSDNMGWSSSSKGTCEVMGSTSPFQIQQGSVSHPRMNGFNDGFGPSSSSSSLFNPSSHASESSLFDASRSLTLSKMHSSLLDFHGVMNVENDAGSSFGTPYWQNLSIPERWGCPHAAELSGGLQASGSRSSSLRVDSPPQLDLVL